MTQEELNYLVPPPNPLHFYKLEKDKTVALVVDGRGNVIITVTLREIKDGVAFVQLTHALASTVQVPRFPGI